MLQLHDVFDYGDPEITAIVGRSEDDARPLASRAGRHVKLTGDGDGDGDGGGKAPALARACAGAAT